LAATTHISTTTLHDALPIFFGKDLLLLQVRNNLARLPQRIFKRSLDMVGAVLLTLLLSPVFLMFAFLIWKEDRRPVFFRQVRVGDRKSTRLNSSHLGIWSAV